jgi:Mg2+/Co2+ transporter CorB
MKEVMVVSSAIAATKLALLPILITELLPELCTISSGDRVSGLLEANTKGERG